MGIQISNGLSESSIQMARTRSHISNKVSSMMMREKRKRFPAALLMAACCACLLTGCSPFRPDTGEDETDFTDAAQEDLITVGFSQIGSESVWRMANTESIENALSADNGFFCLSSNARQKQENQIKQLRSFISQQVDYLVFSPIVEDGWSTVLEEAQKADIPVIMTDRQVSASQRKYYTAWIGSDMRAEGEKAGHWLEKYLKEQGRENEDLNIVVLQGTKGSSAQVGRTIGFDTISEQHANWHILDQKEGEFTNARGKEIMQQFLRDYDDIDVIVSQNDDMTFGVIEALEEAGISMKEGERPVIISFDAVKEALELVAQGTIDVDIECNPESGPQIAQIIKKLDASESVPLETYVEEHVFTKENVSEYLDSRVY